MSAQAEQKDRNKDEDHWSAEAYQHSASFVPQMTTKVVSWLDLQPDDKILDLGCGDGVLTMELAKQIKARNGAGLVHGTDSSASMIASAAAASSPLGLPLTFGVADGTALAVPPASYTKIFSNAALHWFLTPSNARSVFDALHAALAPSGALVFEMGGAGNIEAVRLALHVVLARRLGADRAKSTRPWFFPDEEWVRNELESEGKWVVERTELEWRPTPVPEGRMEGYIRLMGQTYLDEVAEGVEGTKAAERDERDERDECIREVVELLDQVCGVPGKGHVLAYVRLRCRARRV